MQPSLRKITTGLGAIVFVGALVIGASGAFFSDTETSTGNTFSAGEIDLQIDNQSYVTNPLGQLVFSSSTSWGMSNLTNQLFFNFQDVKPGDIGEDTISVHAGSNNAWACMAGKLTATPENTLVDPEVDAGDAGPANANNGELQNFLNFTFWRDDGDNVFETGETQITQLTGPASSIFNGAWLPLADSSLGASSTITGGSTRYIGKAWCFGTLTPNGTTQDGTGSSTPLTRGTTGFTCDGSGNNNIAQTDGINVDVSFQAVQTRNNAQFLCSSLPPFGGGNASTSATTTLTVTKVIVPGADETPPATTTFSFSIDGGANIPFEADGTNVIVVSAAPHSVVETVSDPEYSATYTNSSNANINCNALSGSNLTCTITNTFGPVRPEVGSDFTTFVAPTGGQCNVTATSTIQSAIDSAVAGNTVCVPAGTYNEDVSVNKDITLAGAGAATTNIVGQTAGEAGAVVITANGATVQGFNIVDAVGGIAALRISGAHSNILIDSNRLTSASGGANAFLTDGGQSNVMVSNNEIVGNNASQLAYVNGTASVAIASANVDFFQNSFSGTIVAGGEVLGNEATGADITQNEFASTLTSTFAILESFEDDANVNFNNFNGVGGIKVRDSDAGAGPLDAENNWWGAAVPVGNTAGDVDDVPKEASAFPQN